jgi:hypothetical protein
MATNYNISIYQGDYFQASLSVKDSNNNRINLSGYDVRGQVRNGYGSTGVLLNLNPSVTSHVSGIINIAIDSSVTEDLPVGQFVYDIERFPSGIPTGNTIKLMLGKFSVSPEVTR